MECVVRTIRAAGKVSFAAVALAAILSCSQANMETDQKWLSFRCPVMARFGARYSDGKTTFWNRGKSVLMEVDDKIVVQDCMLL
ncbi:MAG TPA: hypothetical protein VLJ79_34275 [Candidatus Binatia bacterium]|nr:hypothetical protein [Candidatus Binatia bacterium]